MKILSLTEILIVAGGTCSYDDDTGVMTFANMYTNAVCTCGSTADATRIIDNTGTNNINVWCQGVDQGTIERDQQYSCQAGEAVKIVCSRSFCSGTVT